MHLEISQPIPGLAIRILATEALPPDVEDFELGTSGEPIYRRVSRR